jgi:prepilin-type N-terminal cleavage/methylation domain-containing protein/prepilin-type processing-associated H-X9-DG protein
MQHRSKPSRSAFTLIELLVVIAIIAILIGLLVPAVQKVRDAGDRAQCQNNLKQIALALHSYHDVYKKFPPGGSSAGTEGLSFLVYILPYVEQGNIYKSFNINQAYNSGSNTPLGLLQVPIYLCPSTTNRFTLASFEYSGVNEPWTANYVGNMGPKDPAASSYQVDYTVNSHGGIAQQGVLGMDTAISFKHITDGSSNTFLVGEMSWKSNGYRAWSRGCWKTSSDWNCHSCRNVTYALNAVTYNGSNNFNDVSFGSQHTGGANFAYCDASVHFVSVEVSLAVYRATASRNGNEPQVIAGD